MYSLSLEKPIFMLGILDLDFLKKISHLPITELHTKDFISTLDEIIKIIPSLKCLNVDSFVRDHTLEELKSVKLPMKISTVSIKKDENSLVSLDIEQTNQLFEPSDLKLLSEKVHISDIICTRSCNFMKEMLQSSLILY